MCLYNEASRARTHARARTHTFNVPNLAHLASFPVLAAPQISSKAPTSGPRTQVRQSGIHGKGVYAIRSIREGERVLEYRGEIIPWEVALERHPHDPDQPNHTFYFHLSDGHVIDGKHQGNSAKWINHSCAPNLEAEQQGDRVFLNALRDIEPGEELFFDYALVLEGRITESVKKDYACWCGNPECRGTMLALTARQLKAAKNAATKKAATKKAAPAKR